MLIVLLAAALAAPCPEDPLESLRTTTAEVEVAVAHLDDDGLAESRSRFAQLMRAGDCINQPLSDTDAGSIHRTQSVLFFMDRDWPALTKSLSGARALHPSGWQPTGPILGASPGRQAWRDAGATVETRAPLTDLLVEGMTLAPGGYLIDGTESDTFPANRAFLVQALSGSGDVTRTVYAMSGADIPIWQVQEVVRGPSERAAKVRKHSTILGSVGLGLAAGAFAYAAVESGKVDQAETSEELAAVRRRVNSSTIAGSIIGGSSLTLGIVAWGVRW